MTAHQAAVVRDRACTSKAAMSRRTARLRADTLEGAWAYRCPFTSPRTRHWHVGHVPSIESLQTVADAIRTLAQQAA